MRFRVLQTAWYGMRLLEPGAEFDAPDDFSAPWAQALEAKAKPKAKAKDKAKAEAKVEAKAEEKAEPGAEDKAKTLF